MSATAKGILKVKNNEVQVSDRFKKREFVVTLDAGSQYPQHVQFQLVQDKCSLINDFKLGEEVVVHYNLRGREWTKDNEVRYFNTLDAWRIERVSTPVNEQPVHNTNIDENDGLPF